MSDLHLGDLSGKTILEVGSGRGDTSRELVKHLAGQPGARLNLTDISDAHFAALAQEFADAGVQTEFIRTSALKLAGIKSASIDLLVCSFTLCAVNAISGQGTLALQRFYEVLKPGGELFIREELPIYMAANPAQQIWQEKWAILRALQLLTGNKPWQEYQPDVLQALVEIIGFKDVDYEDQLSVHTNPNTLDFFSRRAEMLLAELHPAEFSDAFQTRISSLHAAFKQVGMMEVPWYELRALKPWRIE